MVLTTSLLMAGAVLLRKWQQSQQRSGGSGGGGRLPAHFRYTVYAVPPAGAERFAREHDDVVTAEYLHELLVSEGYTESAERLAADVRRMSRSHPGCIMVCADFYVP